MKRSQRNPGNWKSLGCFDELGSFVVCYGLEFVGRVGPVGGG